MTRPIGRPRGRQSTRERIVAVAQDAFARAGYEATSLRAVAAEAGVDPSTVVHFFGSKGGLFIAVVEAAVPALQPVAELLAEGAPGREIAAAYLGLWASPATGSAMQALMRTAVGSPEASSILQHVFLTHAVDAAPEDQRLGVALAVAQLVGVALSVHVAHLSGLEAASDDLMDAVGLALDAARGLGPGTLAR